MNTNRHRQPKPPCSFAYAYHQIERYHTEHRHHLIRKVSPLTECSHYVTCSCGQEFFIVAQHCRYFKEAAFPKRKAAQQAMNDRPRMRAA